MAALDAEDFGYVELYRVRHDRLAEYYAGRRARLGRARGHRRRHPHRPGARRRLLRALADALLRADPRCHRVVAEPDIGNTPSVRAFAAAGFVSQGELQLPEKTALLMVRTRTVEA